MKNETVTPEQFSEVVMKALSKYGEDVFKTTENAAKSTGRQTTSELKSTSPVNRGSYARGWASRRVEDGGYGFSYVVHNRTDYQLIHLLEKPHETGGGGHYPQKKDHTGQIARIEEKYVDQFFNEVISKL